MSPLPVLFYDDRSPPVRSCLMLIKMLNIDVKCEFVDLFKGAQFESDFLQINPAHTVPTLIHDELILTDSHVILLHLCQQFEKTETGNKLLPEGYFERVHVLNMLFFECSTLFRRDSEMMSAIVRRGFDSIDISYHERKIMEAYNMMEHFLQRHTFMAENYLTLADISLVTTLSTVDLMFPVVADKWPQLYAWYQRMQQLPAYEINVRGLEKLRVIVEKMGKFQFPNKNKVMV